MYMSGTISPRIFLVSTLNGFSSFYIFFLDVYERRIFCLIHKFSGTEIPVLSRCRNSAVKTEVALQSSGDVKLNFIFVLRSLEYLYYFHWIKMHGSTESLSDPAQHFSPW